jgi:hypothetical protein
MLLGLGEEIFNNFCFEDQENSQTKMRFYLKLLRSMKRCLTSTCVYVEDKELNRLLLKTNNITQDEFCAVTNRLTKDIHRPLNQRNWPQRLRKLNLTVDDFDFSKYLSEKDMFSHMKYISEKIPSDKRSPTTYDFLLHVILFLNKEETEEEEVKHYASPTIFLHDVVERNSVAEFTSILQKQLSLAAIVYVIWWFYKNNEQIDNRALFGRNFRNAINSRSSGKKHQIYFQVLIREYARIDAHHSLTIGFWTRLDESLSNYLYTQQVWPDEENLFELARYVELDHNWTMFLMMLEYREGIKNGDQLQSSFDYLTEDLIKEQCLAQKEAFKPYLDVWKEVQRGIIRRIWFRSSKSEQAKLRDIMRFFPITYRLEKRSFLETINPSEECRKWTALKEEKQKETACGCNCVCSTQLALLISNDVGLLGKRVHYVVAPKHVYIIYGTINQVKNVFSTQNPLVFETTIVQDEDVCIRPFSTALSESESKLYAKEDTLLPNFYEFYIYVGSAVSAAVKDNVAYSDFIVDVVLKHASNLYGTCMLLNRAVFELVFDYGRQEQVISLLAQLAKKEVKHKTLDLMSIQDIHWALISLMILLDDWNQIPQENIWESLKIIIFDQFKKEASEEYFNYIADKFKLYSPQKTGL